MSNIQDSYLFLDQSSMRTDDVDRFGTYLERRIELMKQSVRNHYGEFTRETLNQWLIDFDPNRIARWQESLSERGVDTDVADMRRQRMEMDNGVLSHIPFVMPHPHIHEQLANVHCYRYMDSSPGFAIQLGTTAWRDTGDIRDGFALASTYLTGDDGREFQFAFPAYFRDPAMMRWCIDGERNPLLQAQFNVLYMGGHDDKHHATLYTRKDGHMPHTESWHARVNSRKPQGVKSDNLEVWTTIEHNLALQLQLAAPTQIPEWQVVPSDQRLMNEADVMRQTQYILGFTAQTFAEANARTRQACEHLATTYMRALDDVVAVTPQMITDVREATGATSWPAMLDNLPQRIHEMSRGFNKIVRQATGVHYGTDQAAEEPANVVRDSAIAMGSDLLFQKQMKKACAQFLQMAELIQDSAVNADLSTLNDVVNDVRQLSRGIRRPIHERRTMSTVPEPYLNLARDVCDMRAGLYDMAPKALHDQGFTRQRIDDICDALTQILIARGELEQRRSGAIQV